MNTTRIKLQAILLGTLALPLAVSSHYQWLIKGDAKYLGRIDRKHSGIFVTCDGTKIPVGSGKVEKARDKCPHGISMPKGKKYSSPKAKKKGDR